MAASDVFGIVGTTQAGNFRVERVVAEGGFGVVYRAQHEGFRAPVALKCLKIPEELNAQQRTIFLEKFREEAELMFRLSGAIPEVCRPLHVDVLHLADGRFVPFLALEWLDGESLDGIITRRREHGQAPLGLHKLVKMMRPIARALSRAHHFPATSGTLSIIHRDLKPENLFLASIGGKELIKVLDFGVATAKRAAAQAAGRVTGSALHDDETASFTPAYGAPEQWSPKTWGETGPWTDVWGLALTMVEALTGSPPIDGDTYDMRRICLDERRRPTPRTLGAGIPVEVETVFVRALSIDPRERFKDIEGFWSELEVAMGLSPSMVSVDPRREPLDSADDDGPSASGVSGARLARIELRRPIPPSPPGSDAKEKRAEPSSAPPGRAGRVRASGPPENTSFGDRALVLPRPVTKESSAEVPWDLEFELPGVLGSDHPQEPRRPAVGLHPATTDSRDSATHEQLQDGGAQDATDLEEELPTHPTPGPRGARISSPLPGSDSGPVEQSLERPSAAARIDFDLAVGTTAPRPAPLMAPPEHQESVEHAPVARARGTMASDPIHGRREAVEVRERLRAPLGVLVVALLVALVEVGYAKMTGSPPSIGPVRPFWVAAPLAVFGVAFTLWRLIGDHDDE